MSLTDVRAAAIDVLKTGAPREKAAAARTVAARWRAGELALPDTDAAAPDVPAPNRPAQPELVPPGKVPRRRLHSIAGRTALLHAIAHIEFNAIDLAFDLVARFGADPLIPDADRQAFVSDWIGVGDDEARHFILIEDRLNALGAGYGDLPAHNGLWDAAQATQHDLAARLAVAPLVLEARGLDVTPGMIERLKSAQDMDSAACLQVIYEEEIGHVAAGARWFETVCRQSGEEVEAYFHQLVRKYYRGNLKPPFNATARKKAGLETGFYEPLAL